MINVSVPRFSSGWVSAILISATCGACSGTSDSENAQPNNGGAPSSAGSGPKAGSAPSGGGGAPSTSGSSQGGQSTSGSGSGGASAGKAGAQAAGGESGGDCMPRDKITMATHIVMNITWPDTLAAVKGTGQFHLWNRSQYTVTGTTFSGESQPCGSILPPLELSAIAGGGKTLIEIPEATWDLPSMPKVMGSGTIAGWTVGSKFTTAAASALVGLMMTDPESAWPGKGSMISGVDHDSDTKPGILGVPKADGGFLRPPTSILGQAGAIADQVYLVTRTAVGMDGALTSCTEQSGTVDVKFFDNHVIGCHIYNGGECDATQADFIDSNRTIYQVTNATYTSKFVDEATTCADVRAALPVE